ncbi:MAG TPA: LptA/OstA family protein [Methylocella sp.]|nr:LptA/OstA family protein [Methylocella sp.]
MTFFRRFAPAAGLIILSSISADFAAAAEKPRPGIILPGGNSNDPISIDAAKLDYFDKEQKLVYSGNVVATQGESKLRAGTLVIYLAPKSAGNSPASGASQVRRMEAAGPVTIVSKDQVGTGDSGVYDRSDNKVYLIGNVVLTQGPNVTKGDKLTYDLSTSQAAVTGHVRSMFLPNGANGGVKETRPAGASSPERAAQLP